MATLGEYLGAGASTTKLLLHLNGSNIDFSGNNIGGSDTNVSYSLNNGKFREGAYFTGNNVSGILYSGLPLIKDNYTISLWFNTNSFSGLNALLSNRMEGSQEWTTAIYVEPNKINPTVGDGSEWLSLTGIDVPLSSDIWYNCICVFSTTGVKLYINGNYINQKTYSGHPLFTPSNGKCALGYTPRYDNEGYNGKLDEVIVENVVWTPEYIKKYYTYSQGRFGIL